MPISLSDIKQSIQNICCCLNPTHIDAHDGPPPERSVEATTEQQAEATTEQQAEATPQIQQQQQPEASESEQAVPYQIESAEQISKGYVQAKETSEEEEEEEEDVYDNQEYSSEQIPAPKLEFYESDINDETVEKDYQNALHDNQPGWRHHFVDTNIVEKWPGFQKDDYDEEWIKNLLSVGPDVPSQTIHKVTITEYQ